MKKTNLFFMTCKFIMFVLAVAFGGGAMALDNPTAPDYGTDPTTDPNEGTSLEGAVKTAPTDKGGLAQHGQDSNASALQESNLLNNKLTRTVIEYHANKHSLFAAIHSKPQQMSWTGHKEAEYPEVGDIKTEARVKKGFGYNSTSASNDETITLNSTYLHTTDLQIFRPNYTIFVMGNEGYDEGEATYGNTNGEVLMLYVTARTADTITVKALNGPAIASGSKRTYVPAIAEGAILSLAAPSLAEEEVEVDPINIIPSMATAYLQKKGYSVAITDFFNEAVKYVDWEKSRIKRQALDTYKDLYTKTVLFGSKKKFYKTTPNGTRLCYTQDGLLNQVRMSFELPGNVWTKGALIAIAKMLFCAYTDAEEIDVFCGSDAIEGLLNIDWGDSVKEIVYQHDKDYNLDIATFNCTFGKLKFIHELALTKNGLAKAAIAIPMQDTIRIYRDNGKTLSVDGKKGETGRVEELVKDYFIEDDAFICNAMNTMLIGPASVFSGAYGSIKEQYKAVSTMPIEPAVGDIVYLTVATSDYGTGLWKCTTAKTESAAAVWEEYTRDQTKA